MAKEKATKSSKGFTDEERAAMRAPGRAMAAAADIDVTAA
jgi:hypothetical protein